MPNLELWLRLSPLLLLVGSGFLLGRKLSIDKSAVANLLIFFLAPLVFLSSLLRLELTTTLLLIPIFYWVICSAICLATLRLLPKAFKSPARNLLALLSGNSNSGYFGVPAAVMFLGEDAVPIILLISLGFTLYENSVGFYVTARGMYSPRESLRRLTRLPALYAFALGVLLNFAGVRITSGWALDFAQSLRGAYSVLGMMLVGIAIAEFRGHVADWKFTSTGLGLKFIAWPLVGYGLVALDRASFQVLTPLMAQCVHLNSMMPMAANTVAFATILKAEPQKAAHAVLVSTLLALLLLPIIQGFLPF